MKVSKVSNNTLQGTFKASFNEKYCSCCKKYFLPAPQHMYRAKGKFQCSYTCWRKEGGGVGKQPRGLNLEP